MPRDSFASALLLPLLIALPVTGYTGSGESRQALQLAVVPEGGKPRNALRALEQALTEQGCQAEVSFSDQGADLVFRPVRWQPEKNETTGIGEPVLVAQNREGQLPTPVWVTRKTAGVRSLAELQGRDLATLEEGNELGYEKPLQALASHGVTWQRGQLYQVADFNSALGLLLHNNTHAAVSELGLARFYEKPNSLAVTHIGEPLPIGAWFAASPPDPERTEMCLDALRGIQRSTHKEVFSMLPPWVYSFTLPDSKSLTGAPANP